MQRSKNRKINVRLLLLIAVVSFLAIGTGYFLGNFMVDFLNTGKESKLAKDQPSSSLSDDNLVDSEEKEDVLKGEGQTVSPLEKENASQTGSDPLKSTADSSPFSTVPSSGGSIASAGILYLQVASGSNGEFAKAEAKKLLESGFSAFVKQGQDGNFKVLIKVEADKKEQTIKALEALGYTGIFSPRL